MDFAVAAVLVISSTRSLPTPHKLAADVTNVHIALCVTAPTPTDVSEISCCRAKGTKARQDRDLCLLCLLCMFCLLHLLCVLCLLCLLCQLLCLCALHPLAHASAELADGLQAGTDRHACL